ncbi:MAG TPA: malto-oligosyltrehalose synthase [Acidisarcina sp.]|nr:malto-oligosyltrehalose synthase [Acidisarcina sp.]
MRDCIDQVVASQVHAPLSTYRLQMNAGFTFRHAEALVGYLKRLGISALYASPIFEARPGSLHGYDITRHDRLNPELGGDEGFARLSASLQQAGMGLLLDIVPNHMGVGNDSHWWRDVLENGRSSQYAEYFDIDWTPLKPDMQGKLLLPILGRQYGEELESKRIQLGLDDGRIQVHYFNQTIPLSPRTLPLIFPASEEADSPLTQSFRDLLKDLQHIPPHDTADPTLAAQRRKQLAELNPRLREALQSPEIKPIVLRTIEEINGVENDPRSFDRLHTLLEAQPYRLAFWRVSAEEINYRRFFDINDLVGLRMENPVVFAETHCLVRKLLAQHQVMGLRIDHCDGMFNPRQYLIRLQLLYVASQCAGESASEPTAPNGIELSIREALRGYDWTRSRGPLYVVVEKILEPREYIPREWPVSGTTGYDFIFLVNEVFIQSRNERAFNETYTRILGETRRPDEIIYRSKLQVMQTALASEVYVLTNLLSRLASTDRRARDFTDNILEIVIRETIACFPVYRTYIDDRGQYTDRDRAFIHYAISRAKRRNASIDASAFDFLRETLLLRGFNSTPQQERVEDRQLYFALKFQQLTGPVMAKGVEDTAFYVYNRFLSANEVGGSIKVFGIPVDTFHSSNRERLENSPDSMLPTSTHDTKRSEDVRARLNVLSELPIQWSSMVRRWQRMNARYKRTLEDGRVAPDANEEYMLYQTIAGSWPWQMTTPEHRSNFLSRLQEYATKALSEAKVNLSWINPDPAYVEAVQGFLHDILVPSGRRSETRFVESLASILPVLQIFGAINSLAQIVLKIASPGVPDFYQGNELWELSLVDPDNRRPVDYDLRNRYLDSLDQMAREQGALHVCEELLRTLPDGRIKLWTMQRALALRQQEPAIFQRGTYVAISVTEPKYAEHTISFLRSSSETGKSVIAVVPRFACSMMNGKVQMPLGGAWGKAALALPDGAANEYTNVLTGETFSADKDHTLRLSSVFAHFPVALLVSTP